jgi:hypothetical protein
LFFTKIYRKERTDTRANTIELQGERNEDKGEEKESFKSWRRKIELLNEGRELEA